MSPPYTSLGRAVYRTTAVLLAASALGMGIVAYYRHTLPEAPLAPAQPSASQLELREVIAPPIRLDLDGNMIDPVRRAPPTPEPTHTPTHP